MTLKSLARRLIDRSLARRGYSLARTSVGDTGWEEVVRRACASTPQGRPLVLDIGAHCGGFSESVLNRWPKAEVYAFEPIPELLESIRALHRRYPGLTDVPLALGAETGEAEFNIHAHSDSSSLLAVDLPYARLYPGQAALARRIQVKVRRLDDWAGEAGLSAGRHVDLVKMDVQGFEGRVIDGGQATLSRTRYLVTEAALYPCYAGGIMLDELCAKLRALDFELIWGFNVFAASADLFWQNRKLSQVPRKTATITKESL
jgi:FkbM family methyltransferase